MQIIKNKERLFSFLMIVLLLMNFASSMFVVTASAAESNTYTNVLDDLKRDSTFDISAYPEITDSAEIQVIQIAEGTKRELYVYTYQPGNVTNHRKAEYIEMATKNPAEADLEYNLYTLTWLNNDGVFDKYLVNGYSVPNIPYRYYTIKEIYRPYDSDIDDSNSCVIHNGVMCKPYSVNQAWCVYLKSNKLVYEMGNMESIKIVEKNSAFFIVQNGNSESHYLAFSAEGLNINKVYNIDCVVAFEKYVKTVRTSDGAFISESLVSFSGERFNLNERSLLKIEGEGLIEEKYLWDSLYSIKEFKEQYSNYTVETPKDFGSTLIEMQYVVHLSTTPLITYVNKDETALHYSRLDIARNDNDNFVYYLSDGITYDIGRIGSNSSSGSIENDVVGGIFNSSDDNNVLNGVLLVVGFVGLIALVAFLKTPIKTMINKKKNDLGLKLPKKSSKGDIHNDE